jgi:hypothetical protein
MILPGDETVLDRMVRAVALVRERLLRATSALEAADVPYAVAGGHAVAAWVARVDPAAVRNTPDVDVLLRAEDLDAATIALDRAGFVRRHENGVDVFVDGPNGKVREAVHVVLAREKARPDHLLSSPDVTESEKAGLFRIVTLDALVRMKLVSTEGLRASARHDRRRSDRHVMVVQTSTGTGGEAAAPHRYARGITRSSTNRAGPRDVEMPHDE